jgi:hypothetical protein
MGIFTCSSTLGNLSRFIRGVDKSFRALNDATSFAKEWKLEADSMHAR